MSIINYSELTYERPTTGVYTYPNWAVGIGWGIAALSAVCIPLTAIYKIVKYRLQGKVNNINIRTWFFSVLDLVSVSP